MDRIDMWIEVLPVSVDTLLASKQKTKGETLSAQAAVASARKLQQERYTQEKFKTNSELAARHIDTYIQLSEKQKDIVAKAAKSMSLSPRGTHRVLRLARTIADLQSSKTILDQHILEALQYRSKI
jgi:magnesium chelatase family protein